MSTRSVGRASRRDLLKKMLSGLPVGVKLLDGALDPRNASIFQMDIHVSPRFGEYVRIWPGAGDVEVGVLDVDYRGRQFLLRVKEPRRPFHQRVNRSPSMPRQDVEAQVGVDGGRIVSESRHYWLVELWTPQADRRYLCGVDDLHLFIAAVEEGETVAEAHESLKPPVVREAEERWPGGVLRQGEWFFLPLAEAESQWLAAQIAVSPHAVRHRWPVGAGAAPHTADAFLSTERWRWVRRSSRLHGRLLGRAYARGAVVHRDHRTLVLDDWRKVVRNRTSARLGEGLRLRWID